MIPGEELVDALTRIYLECREMLRNPPKGGVSMTALRRRLRALKWATESAIFLTGGGDPELYLMRSPAAKQFRRAVRTGKL